MGQKFAHLNADRFVIGFYDDEWHGEAVPADAVPIADDVHIALLNGQAAGKRMKVRKNGDAQLVDPAAPTADELAAALRSQRAAALASTDWLASRHQDEVLAGDDTTLSAAQFKALSAYRKALRNLPAADGFPNVDLPAAPDFLGAR